MKLLECETDESKRLISDSRLFDSLTTYVTAWWLNSFESKIKVRSRFQKWNTWMLAEYGYHPDGTYKKTKVPIWKRSLLDWIEHNSFLIVTSISKLPGEVWIFDDVSRIDLGKRFFLWEIFYLNVRFSKINVVKEGK